MKIEEFKKLQFTGGMKVIISEKEYDLVTYDLSNNSIGIELDTEIIMVDCRLLEVVV